MDGPKEVTNEMPVCRQLSMEGQYLFWKTRTNHFLSDHFKKTLWILAFILKSVIKHLHA